jgi:capsular polysaccharide biosynthesis protein
MIVRIPRPSARDYGYSGGGLVSEQALDLRRLTQIVRRHKLVVSIFAALGLLAGVGLVLYRPPMLSSEALVDVVLPPSAQAAAAAQGGSAGINPTLATQIVIASSIPVLDNALRTIDPSASLQTLQSRIQVTNVVSSDILSIRAAGRTAAQAEGTANAVARSYVAYVNARSAQAGQVQARVLQPAITATGPSLNNRLVVTGGLGALLGVLVGTIMVLAFYRRDQRLRKRDEIADSIGVPVLASIRVAHPSGASGWTKLLMDYEPGAVDAWRLRKALQHLGLADVNLNNSDHGRGSPLEVLSFGFDSGALALGPQLAVFAASRGIPTALVVGPQQDVSATATLRAACAAPPAPSRRPSQLKLIVRDHDSGIRQPDATLTVLITVVDGQNPQVTGTTRATTTVLGVSAGAATAEQVARVAASAAAAGRDITGIFVANPDPDDYTTGRLPQLARPTHRSGPTRMTGTTAETR